MQAADGPNSSQREWHQIGVKTKIGRLLRKLWTQWRGKVTFGRIGWFQMDASKGCK